MKNKTCGECKHYKDGWCVYSDDPFEVEKDSLYCDDRFFVPKPTLTNGEKLWNSGYDSVITFSKTWMEKFSCWADAEAWLNAPADALDINVDMEESEGSNE